MKTLLTTLCLLTPSACAAHAPSPALVAAAAHPTGEAVGDVLSEAGGAEAAERVATADVTVTFEPVMLEELGVPTRGYGTQWVLMDRTITLVIRSEPDPGHGRTSDSPATTTATATREPDRGFVTRLATASRYATAMKDDDFDRPSWLDTLERMEFFTLLEKYRDRVAHPETGLPFAPTKRDQPFTIEGLAFHTKGPLRIALKVFMPVCVVAFGVSFLWDGWGLIRSCSVAGMIGFGTNWVAIKMLFWPRESRPVFGHGLIPSQRDDLIDKVATEVLENLINEELIVEKIDETRIIERFTESAIDKLNLLVADPEFKADVRRLVLTYVGEIASNPTFRQQILTRAEGAMEEFAGDRFKGWLVHKLRDRWRAPLVRFVNQEIEGLDKTLGEGLDELDPVLEKLPAAMLARQEQIERMLTKMLIGLVNEVDLRAIVYEQLSTVTPEQLETSFREFSDDKLSYITLLGGIFGVIGGTVIVWPLPAIAVLLTLLGVLALLDVVLYRVVRAPWWPRARVE